MTDSPASLAGPVPPKVAVILPNYNHARYLPRRIDSVLNQTFQDFELLIMDDCSTDDSRAVIASYAGRPKVRTLLNEANSGSTFKQWNKGVAATRSRYVWFAESDDYADPRLLERLVGLLDAHSSVGVAYCESNVIDAEGTVLRTTHDDFLGVGGAGHWHSDFVAGGRDECARYLSQQNMIPNASATVFRRDLFEAVGGADASMRLCGDWKMWAAMLLRSDLAHVAEPLNFYRFHAQNVRSTTRSWQSLYEATHVVNTIHQAVNIPPDALLATRRWLANLYLNAALNNSPDNAFDRSKVTAEMKKLDPAYRRRIAGEATKRAVALVGKGKVTYWVKRLLTRSAGQPAKAS
jgi:glycosyltransferase involved in cell wall biosynthesis